MAEWEGNDLVSESDTRGNVTVYAVDGVTSRNEQVTDRCGNQTAYTYDTAGHVTRVANTGADGAAYGTVDYTYDACDNLTAITRGDGMQYVLGYDPFRNLTSIGVHGAEHPLVQYAYKNGSGRLKEITYANGDKMTATYNGMGQLVAEKWYNAENTLTAHYKYVYDGVGNLVRSIDILAAKEYTYTYEEGTLTRAAAYSVTVSENEIITARTLLHSVRYVYDGEGTLVKKEFTAGGITHVVTFTNEENRTAAQFAVGGTEVCCQSETDHFGRKVSDALQLGDNDLTRAFAYQDGVLPQEHVDSGKAQSAATTQLVSSITFSGGRTIAYEYDAEERITKVTDSVGGVTEYTYDALGQLLTERVNGTLVNRMTYDSYGNILTKNGVRYTYDTVWRDKLIAYGDDKFTYDAQGNPYVYRGHALAWEKGRQLKSFDNIQYTYNANGIRTGKTVGDIRHEYVLDGAKILRETWGENTVMPLYDNEDSVCGIVYNDVSYYFQKNLQGDIIAIVDANAQTVAKYSYDAWGVCTITQDEVGIGAINPYRYRGYYYDAETGLYYLQSRYYDAVVGRFMNIDSVMGATNDIASYDLYVYCANCPIDRRDESGMFWSRIGAAVQNFLKRTNKKFLFVGIDTAAIGAAFLNMQKDRNGIYHAKFDCWQQYFGYNDFYDLVFSLGTSMACRKFPFSFGGTQYILWAWKGDYINLGAGAELGIYYGGPKHWRVNKKLAMDMSMTLKWRGRTIISYSARTWWITGFNPCYLNVRASDLKVTFSVKFKNKQMYNAFCSKNRSAWICANSKASYTF